MQQISSCFRGISHDQGLLFLVWSFPGHCLDFLCLLMSDSDFQDYLRWEEFVKQGPLQVVGSENLQRQNKDFLAKKEPQKKVLKTKIAGEWGAILSVTGAVTRTQREDVLCWEGQSKKILQAPSLGLNFWEKNIIKYNAEGNFYIVCFHPPITLSNFVPKILPHSCKSQERLQIVWCFMLSR